MSELFRVHSRCLYTFNFDYCTQIPLFFSAFNSFFASSTNTSRSLYITSTFVPSFLTRLPTPLPNIPNHLIPTCPHSRISPRHIKLPTRPLLVFNCSFHDGFEIFGFGFQFEGYWTATWCELGRLEPNVIVVEMTQASPPPHPAALIPQPHKETSPMCANAQALPPYRQHCQLWIRVWRTFGQGRDRDRDVQCIPSCNKYPPIAVVDWSVVPWLWSDLRAGALLQGLALLLVLLVEVYRPKKSTCQLILHRRLDRWQTTQFCLWIVTSMGFRLLYEMLLLEGLDWLFRSRRMGISQCMSFGSYSVFWLHKWLILIEYIYRWGWCSARTWKWTR